MALVLQTFLLLFFPFLSQKFNHKSWLSPALLCYAVGILLANLPIIPLNHAVSKSLGEAAILLAIPILLFGTKVSEMIQIGKPMLKAFVLNAICATIGAGVAWATIGRGMPENWKLAGMLLGVFTGGTPNLNAIGIALNTNESSIILLNTAEILVGGIYLLLLLSFVPWITSRFLPTFQPSTTEPENHQAVPLKKPDLRDYLKNGVLSLSIVALSLGACFAINGSIDHPVFVIIAITSLGLGFSYIPSLKKLNGTFETGEYLILVFCIALGLQADFRTMIQQGGLFVLFTAITLAVTLLLHYLFSKFLKIDRDTSIMASTAGVFGPAFVGQIASVLDNRAIIAPGIALGILGYAIGNYLGIGFAYLLKWLLIQ